MNCDDTGPVEVWGKGIFPNDGLWNTAVDFDFRCAYENDLLMRVASNNHVQQGVKFIVVKKGEHGCLLLDDEGLFLLPAYPTEKVVDPTGAGDSFAGGLMGYLAGQDVELDSQSLRKALINATLVASFTVESFSIDGLQATDRQKLAQREEEFLKMLRVMP